MEQTNEWWRALFHRHSLTQQASASMPDPGRSECSQGYGSDLFQGVQLTEVLELRVLPNDPSRDAVDSYVTAEVISSAASLMEAPLSSYKISPGSWWLVGMPTILATARARLTERLGNSTHQLMMMAQYEVLRIGGSLINEILAEGCSVDLLSSGKRGYAMTRFADIQVLIDYRPEERYADFYVDRSVADYLKRWLCH